MSKSFQVVRLGDVLIPVTRSETVVPEKTYHILGAHWYAKGLYTKDIRNGSQIQAKNLYRVERGDFVYNRLFAWKGSFAVASEENHGCYVSNEFPCSLVNQNRIDRRYLWRYFSRAGIWEEAFGLSTGGTPTSRNRLKEDKLLAMKMPLPPVEEQQRIVANIDELAAKIEEASSFCKGAQEEVEMIIPDLWQRLFSSANGRGTHRLDEAAILERGKFSYRPRNDPRFFGGDHPWIQIHEIESSNKYIRTWTQTLNDDGLRISKKFPKGTLLISIAATIGAVGILNFDCCVPDSIVAVIPRKGTNSEFLYYYLGYLRTHLETVAPQSAQKNINLHILSGLPVPKIDFEKQRSIVSYLGGLQTQVDALKQLKAKIQKELDALLPSILDKAFKGEL